MILPFLCILQSLGGLVKSQIAGSYPQGFQFNKSGVWDRARETFIFNKSPVRLVMVVQGPHFENPQFNPLSQFTNEETGAQKALSLKSA